MNDEQIREIIIDHFSDIEADKVIPSASFIEDLKADSLETIELMLEFEDSLEDDLGFRVSIPDSEAEKLTTVGRAIEYLKLKLCEASVHKVAIDKLRVDIGDITQEASFVKDLGAESIASIKAMMKEELGVDVPNEELETVSGTTTYLMQKTLEGRVCEVLGLTGASTDFGTSLSDLEIASASAMMKVMNSLGIALKLKDETTVQEVIDMIKQEIFPQGE